MTAATKRARGPARLGSSGHAAAGKGPSRLPAGQTDAATTSEMRTTMYYDGDCPLCRREVAHYRRIDRAGRVRWLDIATDPEELQALGVSRPEAMARLHVREANGRLVSGAWAFAAVWEQLPYYRWLSRLVRALHLLPLIDIAYRRFARWRFRRRCAEGVCAVAGASPDSRAATGKSDGHASPPQANADTASRPPPPAASPPARP
jgi:predicted DCC family thiol-disulfide oxidoreductase YuxK